MQSNKTYKIGQVVYVVLNKEGKVYPMQVIQEITKRSLAGVETSYMLRGNPALNQTVMLQEISGEIFNTDVEARKALIERATKQLNRLIDGAVKKAGEWFPEAFGGSHDSQVETLFEPAEPIAGDTAIVDMGDGTVAKVKLPTNIQGA